MSSGRQANTGHSTGKSLAAVTCRAPGARSGAHSEPRMQRASLDGSSMEPKKEKHVMGLGQRAGRPEKWVEEVHLQSLLSARDGDQGHSGRGDRG